ncbi:hypothetical protein [Rickettsia endosymbiont of Rhinocyllus conicus]
MQLLCQVFNWWVNSTNPSGTINVNTGLTAGTVTFNAGNAI